MSTLALRTLGDPLGNSGGTGNIGGNGGDDMDDLGDLGDDGAIDLLDGMSDVTRVKPLLPIDVINTDTHDHTLVGTHEHDPGDRAMSAVKSLDGGGPHRDDADDEKVYIHRRDTGTLLNPHVIDGWSRGHPPDKSSYDRDNV